MWRTPASSPLCTLRGAPLVCFHLLPYFWVWIISDILSFVFTTLRRNFESSLTVEDFKVLFCPQENVLFFFNHKSFLRISKVDLQDYLSAWWVCSLATKWPPLPGLAPVICTDSNFTSVLTVLFLCCVFTLQQLSWLCVFIKCVWLYHCKWWWQHSNVLC